MNWKAVDEQDVRRLAKDRFGDVLRHDTISFDDLCEEMEFYDKVKEGNMRKSKKAYEEYLNEIYSGDEAWRLWGYLMPNAWRLLRDGKYGTALRRYDPTAFEAGYGEWQP